MRPIGLCVTIEFATRLNLNHYVTSISESNIFCKYYFQLSIDRAQNILLAGGVGKEQAESRLNFCHIQKCVTNTPSNAVHVQCKS